MSYSTTNALTKGYSGKFGDQYVLRRRGRKSLLTQMPDRSKVEPSEGQKRVKMNFTAAAAYAKDKISDPLLREAYKAKGNGEKSAYNMAMADFLHHPVVTSVNTDFYRGNAGDVIHVEAIDDFKVVRVMLYLTDPNDLELEFGECTQVGTSPEWTYTLQGDHLPVAGQKIRVVAYDLPNHPGELTVVM